MRYGPVTVGDARLRAATDEYNRVAMKLAEQERLAKKDLLIEQKALQRWVKWFKASRLKWIKSERARLVLTRQKRKTIQEKLSPRKAEVEDLDWLCKRYVEERSKRWNIFQAERLKFQTAEAERLDRPLDDITVPFDWRPAGDPPLPATPSCFDTTRKKMVDDIIRNWLTSQGCGPTKSDDDAEELSGSYSDLNSDSEVSTSSEHSEDDLEDGTIYSEGDYELDILEEQEGYSEDSYEGDFVEEDVNHGHVDES
jgi:hypothetical protein